MKTFTITKADPLEVPRQSEEAYFLACLAQVPAILDRQIKGLDLEDALLLCDVLDCAQSELGYLELGLETRISNCLIGHLHRSGVAVVSKLLGASPAARDLWALGLVPNRHTQ